MKYIFNVSVLIIAVTVGVFVIHPIVGLVGYNLIWILSVVLGGLNLEGRTNSRQPYKLVFLGMLGMLVGSNIVLIELLGAFSFPELVCMFVPLITIFRFYSTNKESKYSNNSI